MVKQNNQIEIIDQLAKIMDEHNLAEIEIKGDNIYLKKENPKDIAERKYDMQLDEKLKMLAAQIDVKPLLNAVINESTNASKHE
jgi:hypothetical protein